MTKPSWHIRAVLRAKSSAFRFAVDEAHRIVQWGLKEFGEPAISSVSGGKDSVAMAHIVHQHCKAPILWNDSGLELPESKAVVQTMSALLESPLIVAYGDAMTVKLRKGPERAEQTASSTNETCIVRPVRKLLAANGAKTNFVGLRMGESQRRRILLRKSGYGYQSQRWGCGVVWPLRSWSGIDSIAYIVQNNLPLHPAYLRGDFPENIRVSWLWDSTREQFGEFEILRRYYPKIFHYLRSQGVVR